MFSSLKTTLLAGDGSWIAVAVGLRLAKSTGPQSPSPMTTVTAALTITDKVLKTRNSRSCRSLFFFLHNSTEIEVGIIGKIIGSSPSGIWLDLRWRLLLVWIVAKCWPWNNEHADPCQKEYLFVDRRRHIFFLAWMDVWIAQVFSPVRKTTPEIEHKMAAEDWSSPKIVRNFAQLSKFTVKT